MQGVAMTYIVPVSIIVIFCVGAIRGVGVYDCFSNGIKKGLKLIYDIAPAIISVFVLISLCQVSGITTALCDILSPILTPLGIPREMTEFILLRPLTGSGSIAMFQNIIDTCGANSYPARASAVIMGSSETVFYVATVYFSSVKNKKLGYIIPISLLLCLLSVVLSCIITRVI